MSTVHQVLATKLGMTQAWTTNGKRLAVTRLQAADLMVVGSRAYDQYTVIELGVGQKKLKNTHKPLRSRLEKSGFSVAPRQIKGTRITEVADVPAVGSMLSVVDQLTIGDVVSVQGTSKGQGFAGVVKRYGFAGGPKTHGQSDRHRAPGSIGNRTTPGRVFKNKRMPGHYGVDVISIPGLVVVHIDSEAKEVWVSGPVPGSYGSIVQLQKTGQTKKVKLDNVASGLPEKKIEGPVEEKAEIEEKVEEVVETTVSEEASKKESLNEEVAVDKAETVDSKDESKAEPIAAEADVKEEANTSEDVKTEVTKNVDKTEEKVDVDQQVAEDSDKEKEAKA